jgi:hypothetical protein
MNRHVSPEFAGWNREEWYASLSGDYLFDTIARTDPDDVDVRDLFQGLNDGDGWLNMTAGAAACNCDSHDFDLQTPRD